MDEQKIVISIKKDGNINVVMDPPLMGGNSDEYKKASSDDRAMQQTAASIVMHVVELLKDKKNT